MNVFELHRNVVADYEKYIRSFIRISDPKIAEVVDAELSRGKLWPEPLLQFNPTYGWHEPGPMGPAINLAHDFYEVETLSENDRTRYTISPAARKELLARLLKENHRRAAAEAASAPVASKKPAGKSRGKKKSAADDEGLFT